MKTFLVLLVAFSMILVMTCAALAVENSGNVYFDLAVSGSSENDINGTGFYPTENNLKFDGKFGFTLGYEYNFDSFKAVLAYSQFNFENSEYSSTGVPFPIIPPGVPESQFDYTAAITNAKLGYRLINTDNFTLYGVIGYLGLSVSDIEYEDGSMDFDNGGAMAGLDFSWKVSDKLEITANYATTFNANSSMKSLDEDMPGMFGVTDIKNSSTLSEYRIKAIYMFWEDIGLSLSYSGLNSTLKYTYTHPVAGKEIVKDEATYSGWALGVIYKF